MFERYKQAFISRILASGAVEAVKLCSVAFDAPEFLTLDDADRRIMHDSISLDRSTLLLSNSSATSIADGATVALQVHLPGADSAPIQAVAPSDDLVSTLADMSYGARQATPRDSLGRVWTICTPIVGAEDE